MELTRARLNKLGYSTSVLNLGGPRCVAQLWAAHPFTAQTVSGRVYESKPDGTEVRQHTVKITLRGWFDRDKTHVPVVAVTPAT